MRVKKRSTVVQDSCVWYAQVRSGSLWFCNTGRIILPMHEIEPIKKRKPKRSFASVDILILLRTMRGAERRAKSVTM